MLTIRTIGVAIAFSAAATAFAGEQVQWRADELSTDSQLNTRQPVMQAASWMVNSACLRLL